MSTWCTLVTRYCPMAYYIVKDYVKALKDKLLCIQIEVKEIHLKVMVRNSSASKAVVPC